MSTQKVVPSTVSGVVSATKPRPRPPLPRPKPRPADLFPALRPRPPGARIICLNFSNVRVCVVTHRKSQPPHRLLGRPFPFRKLKSAEWSHMISVILLYDTTHSLYKNTGNSACCMIRSWINFATHSCLASTDVDVELTQRSVSSRFVRSVICYVKTSERTSTEVGFDLKISRPRCPIFSVVIRPFQRSRAATILTRKNGATSTFFWIICLSSVYRYASARSVCPPQHYSA